MHQPVRIHDSDGNPITASNPLEVDVKVLAAPATLPLPAGAALESSLSAINAKLATLVDSQAPVVAGYKTTRLSVALTGIGATSQYDMVGSLTEIQNWASAAGRGATLRRLWIEVNNNAIAPQFELHFFNANNPTVAGDNNPWTSLAADVAKRAGYINVSACAKPAGSGTIDIVRAQAPDDFGASLDMQMTCAAASTSLWLALKLLTSGISFAAAPGNTITVIMEIEQS